MADDDDDLSLSSAAHKNEKFLPLFAEKKIPPEIEIKIAFHYLPVTIFKSALDRRHHFRSASLP